MVLFTPNQTSHFFVTDTIKRNAKKAKNQSEIHSKIQPIHVQKRSGNLQRHRHLPHQGHPKTGEKEKEPVAVQQRVLDRTRRRHTHTEDEGGPRAR